MREIGSVVFLTWSVSVLLIVNFRLTLLVATGGRHKEAATHLQEQNKHLGGFKDGPKRVVYCLSQSKNPWRDVSLFSYKMRL